MDLTQSELEERLRFDEFPRSSKYDPQWMIDNQMGPNVIWLTEALDQCLDLRSGTRVLDLGCGRAISSIFLAKEFGVQVWATDLWIQASENWERIVDADVADRVHPIHAEAHTLPFAEGFFDVVVSMDAYHYFGTDDLYLGTHLQKFVKPGGEMGIVVPGMREEFEGTPPEYIRPYWGWDYNSFHSPAWWRWHWEKSGMVTVDLADFITADQQHWLTWCEVVEAEKSAQMLREDNGSNLGFTRVVARKKEDITYPLYPFNSEVAL